MPIFTYFAVVGSVLVALLFVADARLPKQGPALVSSHVYGLPKPWQPDPARSISRPPRRRSRTCPRRR